LIPEGHIKDYKKHRKLHQVIPNTTPIRQRKV
jgi:hypothetical protein